MHRDTESKFSMIGSIITPDNLVPFQVSLPPEILYEP